jgi:prepilin-type N-terminal cleavage/methylation domain-containing protein
MFTLYSKLAKYKKPDQGFTLIEVLLATVIIGIVAASATAGLTAILNQSQRSERKTEERNKLNRALDYISEDVKGARVVQGLDSNNDGNDDVLQLAFPDGSNVYYRLSASNSVWRGPNMIQRSETSPTTGYQTLVDGVTNNNIGTCTGGTAVGEKGFLSCITTASVGSITVYKVELKLAGEEVEVESRVFARSLPPGVIEPLIPPLLSVAGTGANIEVSWSGAAGGLVPYIYSVFRCQTGQADPDCTPTLYQPNKVSPFTEDTISAGNKLCYQIKVTDYTSSDEMSNIDCYSIEGLTPPELQLTRNAGDISITWTGATGGSGEYTYDVIECTTGNTDPDCTPNSTHQSGLTSNSSTDTFTLGQKLCYFIRTDDGTETADTVTKCISYESLTTPSLSIDEPSPGNLNLQWSGVSGGTGNYSYNILKCIGTSCTPTNLLQENINSLSVTDTITTGQTACYKIVAKDTVETTESATVCEQFGGIVAPVLSVTQSVGAVTLSWTNATDGTTPYTYDILKCVGENCTPSAHLSNKTSPFTGETIANNQTLGYQIKVTDGSNKVKFSNINYISYVALTAPTLNIGRSNADVDLSWLSAVGGTGNYLYQIFKCSTTPGNSCSPSTSYQSGISGLNTADTIAEGQKFCYKLQVNDGSDTKQDISGDKCVERVVANNPPIANNDSVCVAKNKTGIIIDVINGSSAGGNIFQSNTVADTDPDGDTLTLSSITLSGSGSASINNGRVSYNSPNSNSGIGTVTYVISDGKGGTATATLTINTRNNSGSCP